MSDLTYTTNNMGGFRAEELAVLNDAYQRLLAERLDADDPSEFWNGEVARVTREEVLGLWAPGLTADEILTKAHGGIVLRLRAIPKDHPPPRRAT